MTIEQQSERELASAVRQLTEVVRGLQDMMKHDYPRRDEIERDFVSKYGIKRRRFQYAMVTIVAIVASYVFAMGTVSYCFLQGPGLNNDASSACNILPGYEQVVEYNIERRVVYNNVIKTTVENEARLDAIENELDRRGPKP